MAWAALRMLLVLTVVTGVVYPLVVTGIGQVAFHDKANGSMIEADGKVVGSTLIGQSWNYRRGTDQTGPQVVPGPSVQQRLRPAGHRLRSQLGADDPTLVKNVRAAKKQVAEFNGVPESEVPVDAVTGSASAIDPDISPEYADIQVQAGRRGERTDRRPGGEAGQGPHRGPYARLPRPATRQRPRTQHRAQGTGRELRATRSDRSLVPPDPGSRPAGRPVTEDRKAAHR